MSCPIDKNGQRTAGGSVMCLRLAHGRLAVGSTPAVSQTRIFKATYFQKCTTALSR